jgi:hypothetical protein
VAITAFLDLSPSEKYFVALPLPRAGISPMPARDLFHAQRIHINTENYAKGGGKMASFHLRPAPIFSTEMSHKSWFPNEF